MDRRGDLFKRLQFSTDTLRSLDKFDLCIELPHMVDATSIFGLLQHLHGVKFLTLNSELVEFLALTMEKHILHSPSPFANLMGLKIYPKFVYVNVYGEQRPLSTEIKNYFLDGSPSASFTFISRKELAMKTRIRIKDYYHEEKMYWLTSMESRGSKCTIT
ncbi:hypothetical protein QVD17_04243 [Tagetes erecta]|uniref:Uncharacterized protein n=1 Tax=Tagetes erecta TaxID=13708 RepID=A0AAD8L9S5_TARER|nr:hypothetical protein QVD17_04243 [Tagetes erecta]